ncbi:DotI/IcmL/TraM family protein [Pseudovibrio ascidiaceicola]|uniref:DotI/IcmL/TraM family protein n=1 Tax=Pseudovibrio ascidiaceicola TaxID=285279 RepID=UPI003D35DD28
MGEKLTDTQSNTNLKNIKAKPVPFGKVRSHADMATATEIGRVAHRRETITLVWRISFGLVIALVLLAAHNIYLSTRPVVYKYFATSPDGQLRPLQMLTRPIHNETEIIEWGTRAAKQSYTFTFKQTDQQLKDLRQYFTQEGWTSYLQALGRRSLIDRVNNGGIITQVTPTRSGVIVNSGLVKQSSRYGWRMELPINVSFQNANGVVAEKYTVDMTIITVPETENPNGLGIARLDIK